MNIESVLKHLRYNIDNSLKGDYFQMFSKEESHIFIYKSAKDGKRYFSSASGEFTGDQKDLITFFYETENSSLFNESERIEMFYELHKNEIAEQKELKPIDHFNLYHILLKEANKTTDQALINSVETEEMHYFFFMDEEKINSGKNILGVVSLDKITKEEKTLFFSELNRSIYFTNPSIASDQTVIFNSFKEMLAFKALQQNNYLYIVVKETFNEIHAKTISVVLKSKGIKKTYLCFPNNLNGYTSDLNYLSVFSNIKIKKRTAFYKLSIPITKESDLLIQKIKIFKKSVEKEIETNTINQLIILSQGKDYLNNTVFIVELPKIANVIKGFLVLSSKYLFRDKEYKIIKPKEVFWSEQTELIKNVDKEHKINLLETIKEVYSFN